MVLILGISSASTKFKGELSVSPVTCSSNNISCDNTEDNLIDTYGGIKTIEECRQICYDSKDCQFITYYEPNSFPISEVCFLFRQCEETNSCTGCVSETRGCYRTCGKNFVGKIDENLVETISGVKTEVDCLELCSKSSQCTYYTYFLEEDEDSNSQTCFLLSSFLAPLQECENCVSGPEQCEGYEDCKLLLHGEQHTFYMFEYDYYEQEFNVHIPHPFGTPQCQVRIFAVGAGGSGGNGGDNKGGGGSGYFSYKTLPLSSPTVLKVVVGDRLAVTSASTVSVNGETIVAEPGFDYDSGNGGDGYSGGGAADCDGGKDGADGISGADYNGGHGTGEDIATILLDNFILSPGNASRSCGSELGGGGGGILVNGSDSTSYETRGYGAGGCLYNSGKPGVILVEVIN